MSTTIDIAFVQQFEANVHRLSAQRESKCRPWARFKSGRGKSFNFERLGAVDMVQLVNRHQDTPLVDTAHSRRRVTPVPFAIAELIDDPDEVQLLISPQSEYAQNFADAANRKYDDIIIAALVGNSVAVDAAEATSNVTLASFNGGSNVIANGSTGFTFEKVNRIVRLLNEQDVPQEGRVCATSPQGIEDLLAETEATSRDFADLMALKSGQLKGTWMGMTWIMSTRLPKASTIRSAIAWHRNAVGLYVPIDSSTKISQRGDKNYSTQVWLEMMAGATRIEEALVVQCDFVEA